MFTKKKKDRPVITFIVGLIVFIAVLASIPYLLFLIFSSMDPTDRMNQLVVSDLILEEIAIFENEAQVSFPDGAKNLVAKSDFTWQDSSVSIEFDMPRTETKRFIYALQQTYTGDVGGFDWTGETSDYEYYGERDDGERFGRYTISWKDEHYDHVEIDSYNPSNEVYNIFEKRLN